MNNKCEFVKEAQQILSEGQLLIDEPMKLHTTFKIGGPADFLIFPANIDELKKKFYGMMYVNMGCDMNKPITISYDSRGRRIFTYTTIKITISNNVV